MDVIVLCPGSCDDTGSLSKRTFSKLLDGRLPMAYVTTRLSGRSQLRWLDGRGLLKFVGVILCCTENTELREVGAVLELMKKRKQCRRGLERE